MSTRAGTRAFIFVRLPARQETGPPEGTFRKMKAVCDAWHFGDRHVPRSFSEGGGRSFLTAGLRAA